MRTVFECREELKETEEAIKELEDTKVSLKGYREGILFVLSTKKENEDIIEN